MNDQPDQIETDGKEEADASVPNHPMTEKERSESARERIEEKHNAKIFT